MSDVAKTPREELECKKKYLYEYSMFWECKDGFKSQILEDDVVNLLNEQEQKLQRWKTLYEIKDKEVTARVDALNKVCEYYTSEVLFKSDVDPNKAVKEVINKILNTEVEK